LRIPRPQRHARPDPDRAPHTAMPPEIPATSLGDLGVHPGISLLQVLAILRAYWKYTAIIGFGLTILSAAVIKYLPKTYTATVTLVVDTNSKGPLATQEYQTDRPDVYLATQTELMLSPVMLLPVVDKLNLMQDQYFTATFSGDQRALREFVAKILSANLKLELGRGGQLMYVSARASDPNRAAEIANAVVDQYLAEARLRAQRYSLQLADLRAKVAAAQDNIAAFRQQKGITDVTPTTDTESQALTVLEGKLLEAQNLRRSLEAKAIGDRASTDEGLASAQIQQLEDKLRDLQSQRAQLSTIYGPQHPKIVALESQIALTKKAVNDETDKLRNNSSTELSQAKALEQKYLQAVQDQRNEELRLRGLQGQGARLELELDSAQSVYKKALDGYEQDMFASVGTNVSVLSRAAPPVYANRPSKGQLLAFCMLLSFGFGAAGPFLYELYFNRRMRCRDDLERDFGLRVLAQFDAISFPAGRA
jgi:polysaccharide biosynthesis transport protein